MRDNLAVLPCTTQFTISEFEEYLFHREKIRLVVNAIRGTEKEHNTLYRANLMVRTSHFEYLLRKCNSGSSEGSMPLHEFIDIVKKGSNISELTVVLGDGTAIGYNGYAMSQGVDMGVSRLPGRILSSYTLNDARNSYQKTSIEAECFYCPGRLTDADAARKFEQRHEAENLYRSGQ